MLISKRRLTWGVVASLCVVFVVLFRPFRSWLDQQVFSILTDGRATVSELHFHKGNIVKAKRLSFYADDGGRPLRLTASQAWFAYEPVALLDKQYNLPSVLLQDVELQLDQKPTADEAPRSLWHQQLAQRVANLDWNSLSGQFESIIRSRQLADSWDKKVDDWLSRSEKILSQSRAIAEQPHDLTNPLRSEDQVRNQLEVLDRLRMEQQLLIEQFDSVRKLLVAESERLESVTDREMQAIRAGAITANADGVQSGAAAESLAEQLLVSAVKAAWSEVQPYAEASCRLTSALTTPADEPPWNVRLARCKTAMTVFNMPKMEANGQFRYGQTMSAQFRVSGNLKLQVEPDNARCTEGLMLFSFVDPTGRVVSVNFEQADQIVLDVADAESALAPSSGSVAALSMHDQSDDQTREKRATAQAKSHQLLHAELRRDANQLFGTLITSVRHLVSLEGASDGALGKALSHRGEDVEIPDELLRLQICGDWNDFDIACSGDTPKWLMEIIENQLAGNTLQAHNELESRYRESLAAETERLRLIGERADQLARSVSERDRILLVNAREKLRSELAEIDGTAFARRPNATITR